jgi:hypothetical protein
MTTIFCDEAGNTGANLLDPEQPFFVLASNDFSIEEANSLLEHVRSGQGFEAKFSSLRRRPEGIARVIRLLADPRLNGSRVRIGVFHKRYMVVSKMVDLVAETLIHHVGGDLYVRGGNIAMSNVLYYCMPVFCGEALTNVFLQRFVELIRHGEAIHKDAFYAAGREMLRSCRSETFKKDLMYFTEPQLFEIWYHGFNWSALDPAIPALFHQIVEWGDKKAERFHVLHDHSKPILASQETFESMLAGSGEDSCIIGMDRRKITFPLRALSLSHGDSIQHPQLQVADLCAGAINHFYRCHISGQMDDLANAVEGLECLEWGSNFVLPQPHVTPEELGTAEASGSNSVEAMVAHLEKKRDQQH